MENDQKEIRDFLTGIYTGIDRLRSDFRQQLWVRQVEISHKRLDLILQISSFSLALGAMSVTFKPELFEYHSFLYLSAVILLILITYTIFNLRWQLDKEAATCKQLGEKVEKVLLDLSEFSRQKLATGNSLTETDISEVEMMSAVSTFEIADSTNTIPDYLGEFSILLFSLALVAFIFSLKIYIPWNRWGVYAVLMMLISFGIFSDVLPEHLSSWINRICHTYKKILIKSKIL